MKDDDEAMRSDPSSSAMRSRNEEDCRRSRPWNEEDSADGHALVNDDAQEDVSESEDTILPRDATEQGFGGLVDSSNEPGRSALPTVWLLREDKLFLKSGEAVSALTACLLACFITQT